MRKKIALILALALCVSLLSGCGGNSGGSETDPTETIPAATTPASAEPTATDSQAPDASETVPTAKEYIVPSVLGRTVEELETNGVILGDFMLVTDGTVFSEDYKDGQICEQSPEAGTMAREGELVITVKISAGPEKMYMPSVAGWDAQEALRVLQNEMGLSVDIQYEFSDTVTDGYVIRFSPIEGTAVGKGDKVTIWVSKRPETSKVTVPNLINARIEDVERQITSVGLTLKSVQYYPNDEYAKGRVFWQSVEAFKEVDRGSPIDLWVSSGSAETALPSQGVEPSQPAVKELTSFTLSSYDITLGAKGTADDHYQLKITFYPADWTGEVIWSSSDERYATVDQYGVVTNVNSTTTLHKAVISVTAGGITQAIEVYCRGVAAGDPPASGSGAVTVGKPGVIVDADGGLNVRSGPGTSYDKIASLYSGDSVNVLEDAGSGWYKISFSGVNGAAEGYILGSYISTD